MTPNFRTVGPKGAESGTYTTTFVYQVPFKKDASTGFRVINEVVLGIRPGSKAACPSADRAVAAGVVAGYPRRSTSENSPSTHSGEYTARDLASPTSDP